MQAISTAHPGLLPSIHPSYVRLLVSHGINKGISLETLFKGTTLDWDSVLTSSTFVSFEQFKSITTNIEKSAQLRTLDLEVSSMIDVSAHGPLGYGAVAAKDLRSAFALVESMLATRINIIEVSFSEEGDQAVLSIVSKLDLGPLTQFVMMLLLGSLLDIVKKTTGDTKTPLNVSLPFSELETLDVYQKLHPQICFSLDHHCMTLSLPVSLLNQPCLTADEFAYRNALRECQQLVDIQGCGGGFYNKVKTALLSSEGEFPTLAVLADRFSMSERTMIRHLKAEGYNYQQILDDVRKELVVWLLGDSSLSIDEIASRAGYIDTSNFSRAFRRWFDTTPREFRVSLRS